MTKSVLITGANGGIGQALCKVLKEAGYWVIASDKITGDCLCDDFIPSNLEALGSDATYRATFLSKVQHSIGGQGLFGLINNAAVQILGSTRDIAVDDWRLTLDVNLLAPFLLTQMFLDDLKRAKGSVINIASVHATNTKPRFVCYATSKSALVGLTRAMAVDLGSEVRVNAICPAATATPMLLAGFAGKESEFQKLSAMHPMGRIAEPEEVAQVALFLLSGGAGFMTGAILEVDGGISARLHDPL